MVVEGGGEMLPTEESHFTRRQAKEGWRLSCQTPVKQDMQIRVPEEVLDVYKRQLYGFGRIGRLLARILIEKTGGGDGLRLRAIVVRKGAENDLVKRCLLYTS